MLHSFVERTADYFQLMFTAQFDEIYCITWATKASAALMDTLSEHLSKEDYALVEELREQMAIAQCEENESHFKYGFSAGLLVQKEAYEQVAQREKE